tara:strand:+ start:427 stop:597 length:171 start_codon:yes stop_codon:yes gene_type:complete
MNITSAQFRELADQKENIVAVIDGKTVYVPIDSNNAHYAEILRQVEAGTLTIKDAE